MHSDKLVCGTNVIKGMLHEGCHIYYADLENPWNLELLNSVLCLPSADFLIGKSR